MKHREIQSAHEESVIDSFTSFLEAKGKDLKVLDRPDPPDAIIEINGKNSWIEITDAFQSPDWAKSITSYAADDKEHKAYKSRLICDPDQEACRKIKEVIVKKYNKRSMNELFKVRGQGILLVGAYTPLTSPEEIIELAREIIISEIRKHTPIFKSIYLYQNMELGHSFKRLL